MLFQMYTEKNSSLHSLKMFMIKMYHKKIVEHLFDYKFFFLLKHRHTHKIREYDAADDSIFGRLWEEEKC